MPTDLKYHLNIRPHNFMLTANNRSMTECDFTTRMLFKDVYGHYALCIAILCIYVLCIYMPVLLVSSVIHRYFITFIRL